MTPGQARFALSSFFLVMAGVAINALFLQARPPAPASAVVERAPSRATPERARKAVEPPRPDRTGPRASVSAAGEHPLHIARFAVTSGRIDGTPETAKEDVDPDTVRAIARELAARGYGPLAIDGAVNLAMRSAIIAFEHDNGLPLTGEASESLLKRILLGAPAASDSAGAGSVDVIRDVQKWLTALGYRPGRVDGRLSEDTLKAIREFELDKGLVPRGRISGDLVARLSEAAAPARAAAR
jgi:peptidoglycan hydrolase-like protein with peptidoglycan-binding domain